MLGPHLGPRHEERVVRLRRDVLRHERLRKAGPAGSGVVFVEGAEKRLAGYDVHIDAGFVVVPILVLERTLRPLVLRDLILGRRELLLELAVVGLLVLRHCWCSSLRGCERTRTYPAPCANVPPLGAGNGEPGRGNREPGTGAASGSPVAVAVPRSRFPVPRSLRAAGWIVERAYGPSLVQTVRRGGTEPVMARPAASVL